MGFNSKLFIVICYFSSWSEWSLYSVRYIFSSIC